MRIVAFVPAKGSSQRIESKNLQAFDGDMLFRRKIRQLIACPLIDEVFLDTEDDALAAHCVGLDVKRLHRPAALATNETDGHELFKWECDQIEADIYVQALCTAPFVDTDTITRALQRLLDHPEHDSLVAVVQGKQYRWVEGKPEYGSGRIPNSIDLPITTIEAMSFYAVRDRALQYGKRFGQSPLLFSLNAKEAVDINFPEDLSLAEQIAAGERSQLNLALNSLAPSLSSGLLSDITRDLGLDCALPQTIKPTSGARVFGRAKTLQLDAVRPGEDWRGIYQALGTYAFVRPGDVIMVGNTMKDRAYFGDLNATLAMRAGAVGAVIDGVTRDSAAVATLGFPVFAQGTCAVDVRGVGVMREASAPVRFGNVLVAEGDYVFGDQDGVICIPATRWEQVKQAVIAGYEREAQIRRMAASGLDPIQIWRELGDF